VKKILSAFLLIASYSVNAENSYIEIGTTNVGSWNSIPSVTRDYGITFPDIVDNSNRSRKFVSFHKELNNDFYLLGSYTKTKTIGSETEYEINSCPFPPYCFPITYVVPGFNLRETVSTLGLDSNIVYQTTIYMPNCHRINIQNQINYSPMVCCLPIQS
jgi:hypothetical protein